jgi:hypothetical protein
VALRKTIALVGAAAAALLGGTTVSAAAPHPPSGSSTGTGQVFAPNPVATLQNQSLTDRKDANYAALHAAYRRVRLTNLDGSGYLHGRWAYVRSSTGKPAYSSTNTFIYNRHDDQFEQVMAYYWVTEAQRYIRSLGFTGRDSINAEPQDVRLNQYGVDNSFFWDQHDYLRFGKGGIDDAEDAEVILHEYGHAMHDSQVPGFGDSEQAGAIGEGFSDYWAMTVVQQLWPTPDPACIADWDSVSYTSDRPHCLRRLDGTKHYPQDLEDEVHADGEIWSRALWDIRRGIGDPETADRIILSAQFDFAPDTGFPAAARATVAAARSLYGGSAAETVRHAFEVRGIL